MLRGFMPSVYGIVVCTMALIVLTIQDIRTKEVNLWVCLAVAVLAAIEPGKNYLNGLYGLLLGFVPIFLLNRIGKGGDGDAIVAGALGFLLGPRIIIYSIFLAYMIYFVVLVVMVIIRKDKKLQLPFMPFLSAGWIIVLLYALQDNMLI